jgi:hypothetical protein
METERNYWEYYVTDDPRRRYVSLVFETQRECWESLVAKLRCASGSYASKIIVKMYRGCEVNTLYHQDVVTTQ